MSQTEKTKAAAAKSAERWKQLDSVIAMRRDKRDGTPGKTLSARTSDGTRNIVLIRINDDAYRVIIEEVPPRAEKA